MLAINSAFGFIAQPLVGLLSDHVWTRIGRRAVFLVTAGPIVAASLVCIPFIGTFAVLVLTVVVLQFFQDVINGSDQPLLAERFAKHRVLQTAFAMLIAGSGIGYFGASPGRRQPRWCSGSATCCWR